MERDDYKQRICKDLEAIGDGLIQVIVADFVWKEGLVGTTTTKTPAGLIEY
jgi:hypothetical protein